MGTSDDAGREERRVGGSPRQQRTRADEPRARARAITTGVNPAVKSPRDAAQVGEHGDRPVELLPAAADADVEPPGEHEVAVPERDPEHGDGGERDERRLAQRARAST